MAFVNLAVVREELFRRTDVVERLCRDFALPAPSSADELARSLVAAFGQVLAANAGSTVDSPNAIFRAAVFALASNSRRWSSFLKVEPQVRALLYSYDARRTAESPSEERASEIARLLGGITGRADSKAIQAWAELLTREPPYAEHLRRLRFGLESVNVDSRFVPGLAACALGFGLPLAGTDLRPPRVFGTWKVPGMGGVLASEFLRNLHWDTYKPDRHILRLLEMWFPDQMREAQVTAEMMASRIFGKARLGVSLRIFLTGTILGVTVTPPGVPLAEADNLIWALGAYVETKGRESTVDYNM